VPDDKFLDVTDLDAGYGRSQVLFGVTMQVPGRGGVAILGRNGAGKTTLMIEYLQQVTSAPTNTFNPQSAVS
jgi:ABC-type branched-subunit amino acid transport system ATPase component